MVKPAVTITSPDLPTNPSVILVFQTQQSALLTRKDTNKNNETAYGSLESRQHLTFERFAQRFRVGAALELTRFKVCLDPPRCTVVRAHHGHTKRKCTQSSANTSSNACRRAHALQTILLVAIVSEYFLL